MIIQPITPARSLNKAYRKTSLRRDEVETFKAGFKRLFTRINANRLPIPYELYGLTGEEIRIEEGAV
jgi:hypothetical protein